MGAPAALSLLALILLHEGGNAPVFALTKCLQLQEVNPKRFVSYQGGNIELKLGVSDRVTHQLTTYIFYIYLKEVLGYPYVSIRPYPKFTNNSEIFEILSSHPRNPTDPPSFMVDVEVWLPSDHNTVFMTETNFVRDCGNTAPPGRWGWFIPGGGQRGLSEIAHWETFADKKMAPMFSLSDLSSHALSYTRTGDKGFYCEESFCQNGVYTPDNCKQTNTKCALLLAEYPDTSGFVVNHIKWLNLYVRVAWVGPHLASLVNHLKERLNPDYSVVFLTYTPSPLTPPFSVGHLPVVFPPCDVLQGKSSLATVAGLSTSCPYDAHRLAKLSWSKLKDSAHPAFESLLKMEFSSNDYIELLTMYRQASSNGPVNMEDVACRWMKSHRDMAGPPITSWRHWEPGEDGRNELFIGGIFPLSGTSYTSGGIVAGALMAINAVKSNREILRDYDLKLLFDDGKCSSDIVMKTFIDYILNKQYKKLVGILGPACSDTVEPLVGVSKYFRTIVLSYSAEGSSFSDRKKYPYFFRTIGENKQYQYVYLELLKKLKWNRVASLTEDGTKYAEYISHTQELLESNHITFVANRKFTQEWNQDTMKQYLKDFKDKNARIIIADINDEAARVVMCEAYHEKMTAKHGYVWFLPLWLSLKWYVTENYNTSKGKPLSCNTSQMIEAINGHFALSHAFFAPDDAIIDQENITVKEWRHNYEAKLRNISTEISDYAGYAYDGVWTYAYALDKLFKENQSFLANIHSEAATNRLVQLIQATDFHGVSGHIKFGKGPSRYSTVNVIQWLDNQTYVVGTFKPNISGDNLDVNGGELDFQENKIKWLSGSVPGDGTPPPQTCYMEWFANFLNTNCEAAAIIAGFVVIIIIISIVVSAFCIVKRRYDKKVQLTQRYIKALGIDLKNDSTISSLDKWEIPRDRVVINRKLGEGAFGTVYGGEAYFPEKGWMAVAVKTLKVGSTTEEKLDFLSEAEVMKRFDHKNIVQLLGVCTKNEPIYTIMEFMLYGDLKTFLLARRHLVNERNYEESEEISSKKLTSMALDVARALSYLAENKYVHRDVASRNCLVNIARVVKLGDFGMTRPMFNNDYYKFSRKGMLPVRWMAPESLSLGVFTPASDVWSYGVLLYEIITFGSFPFQGLSNNQVLEYVKAGNTLTIPSGVKPQLEGLIKSCWELEYKRRPPASEIVELIANNPRLISPCLDVPLSSVQIEDTGPLEIGGNLTSGVKPRKFSVPTSLRQRSSGGLTPPPLTPPPVGPVTSLALTPLGAPSSNHSGPRYSSLPYSHDQQDQSLSEDVSEYGHHDDQTDALL